MKYYIDTEFLEGTQKEKFPISLFRKNTPPTIDLISIGIVAEDNREYYAISKDFNLKEAWNRYDLIDDNSVGVRIGCLPPKKKVYWIRENVLKPIFYEYVNREDFYFNYKNMKYVINQYGKKNKQITEEVKIFVANRGDNKTEQWILEYEYNRYNPEFYGYYSDYDWVVFAWLFGKMIDLPSGFPMLSYDLKQIMDEKAEKWRLQKLKNGDNYTFEHCLKVMKGFKNYPKQTNSHNALSDARWNKELHEFLNKL